MARPFRPRFHTHWREITYIMSAVTLAYAFGLLMLITQGHPDAHDVFQAAWIGAAGWSIILIHLLITMAAAQHSAWKRERARQAS